MATRIGSNYNLVLIDQNIRKARQAHFEALEPLASGRRINHLRDDPSKISEFFRLQNALVRTEQYKLNINTARTRVNLTDTVLTEVTELMNQVYEQAIQGNDETLSTSQITSITDRISDLYDDIADLSNTKVGDSYLFSGYLSTTEPFTANGAPPPAMVFNGDTNNVMVKVTETKNVQVSLNGDYFFTGDAAGTGATTDVFQTIQNLITDITARNSGNIATDITDLQTCLDQFNEARATIGNSMQQLDSADRYLDTVELTNSERMTEIAEADIAEATSELSFREYVLETAFAVSRRVMEVSLQSFFN